MVGNNKGFFSNFNKDNITLFLVVITLLSAISIAIYQVYKTGKIDSLGFSTMGGLAFGTRIFQHGIERMYGNNDIQQVTNINSENGITDAAQVS